MTVHPQSITGFRRPRHGFTLVELLAVIVIVGILAAIVIPVVGAVRKKAQGAQCMANLRAMHTAASLYASEWKRWPTYNQETDNNPRAYGQHRFFVPLMRLGYVPFRTETRDGVACQIGEPFLCPANTDNPGAAYTYITPRTWFPNYAMSTLWNGTGSRGVNANALSNPKAILFIDTKTNPMGGAVIYVPANAAWTSASSVIPEDLHGAGAHAVLANGAVVSVSRQSHPDLGDRKYWDPEYIAP